MFQMDMNFGRHYSTQYTEEMYSLEKWYEQDSKCALSF